MLKENQPNFHNYKFHVNKKIADIEIEREKCRKYLLYISVSVVLVVQNTTAVKLFFCFSRNRRTVPE
jgi:hypothetical protein